MMRNAMSVLMMVVALTACSSYNIRDEFDHGITQYNNLCRWNEWDAASVFAADSIRQEYLIRTRAANKVRVMDYRIVHTRYDEEKRTASVVVEIDYYLLSSARLKTLRDTEEWAYREEQGVKGWRLMSPLPEFK